MLRRDSVILVNFRINVSQATSPNFLEDQNCRVKAPWAYRDVVNFQIALLLQSVRCCHCLLHCLHQKQSSKNGFFENWRNRALAWRFSHVTPPPFSKVLSTIEIPRRHWDLWDPYFIEILPLGVVISIVGLQWVKGDSHWDFIFSRVSSISEAQILGKLLHGSHVHSV